MTQSNGINALAASRGSSPVDASMLDQYDAPTASDSSSTVSSTLRQRHASAAAVSGKSAAAIEDDYSHKLASSILSPAHFTTPGDSDSDQPTISSTTVAPAESDAASAFQRAFGRSNQSFRNPMRSHCLILAAVNFTLCVASLWTYICGNATSLTSSSCQTLYIRSYLISTTLFHGILAACCYFLFQQQRLTSRERLAMTISAFLLGVLALSILAVFSLLVVTRIYTHPTQAQSCQKLTATYKYALLEILANVAIGAATFPRVGSAILRWINQVTGSGGEDIR